MKDSKLKSKDLIRIRKGLGGSPQATTQTARIARKLAEKTAKRNAITLSLTRPPDRDSFEPDNHMAVVKKGGKPIAQATLLYERGVYPEENLIANQRQMRIGNRSGLSRPVAKLGVQGIQPIGMNLGDSIDMHDHIKNTVMTPKDVRAVLKKVSNRFPGADEIMGHRASGVRSNMANTIQKIKLRPSRIGSGPVEAGLTAYATGGGATGAATAATASTGIGAAATAALRTAAKHAPGLARVAGRATPGLLAASAAYDTGRTILEGYRAHEAATNARRNEAYMTKNYGSIEAATRTRHQRR